MNKQIKTRAGRVTGRGIEWCHYTWNAIGGCQHGCRWAMPDGKIAVCYAEDTAVGVAQSFYPQGFEHHYWHPDRLNEPFDQKQSSRIFLDSMADWMGRWVSDDQIQAILDVCTRAYWHDFQALTKNAPRLLRFKYPENLWVGVSSPPDFMFDKRLSPSSRNAMLVRSLGVLSELRRNQKVLTWMSIEPLSWDISPIVADFPDALDWAVIGAASSGIKYFQPKPEHVQRLLNLFDAWHVPIFFKGNLEWTPHREEYPLTRARPFAADRSASKVAIARAPRLPL